MKRLLSFLALLSVAWTFNWSNPVDQMGKPRGIFTTTPFPITEASTTYSVTNDESPNGKAFALGNKFYVDGAAADDNGAGTWASPFKTLTRALATVGSTNGNTTIIVRGAHDAFDGIYQNNHYSWAGVGLSDTQRLTIVGYGQERPVFDGTNSTVNSVMFGGYSGWASNIFTTFQRVKAINAAREVFGVGEDVTNPSGCYFNLIDVHCQSNTATILGNGNIYYLNADNGWVFHCTLERAGGHGAKLGDGSAFNLFEWNTVTENGKWPGTTNCLSRTVGIDYAADRDRATNCIGRYNLMDGCLSHGVQFRRQHAFSFHHNEVLHWGEGIGYIDMSGVTPNGVTILANSWGDFYANKIHDPDVLDTNSILVQVSSSATNYTVKFWNNLMWSTNSGPTNGLDGVYLDTYSAPNVSMLNNSIVLTNDGACVRIVDADGSPTYAGQHPTYGLTNNLLAQWGTGAALHRVIYTTPPTPVRYNNLYWHPNGVTNYWTETGNGQVNADPLFSTNYTIAVGSPAIAAALTLASFTDDLNGLTRTNWDIGALQYVGAPAPPEPPSGFVPVMNVGTLRIGP